MNTRELMSEEQATGPELQHLEMAGRQTAQAVHAVKLSHDDFKGLKRKIREVQESVVSIQSRRDLPETSRRWLRENHRLVRTALRESRDLGEALRDEPAVTRSDGGTDAARVAGPPVKSGTALPRVYVIACEFLNAAADQFTETGLIAFLDGYQDTAEIEMGEIWALKPVLQFALLEKIPTALADSLPVLITSIRHIGEAQWKDLFESTSHVDRVLAKAPHSEFAGMDYDSRDLYRKAIAEIAQHSRENEREVAELAVALAESARERGDGTPAAARRSCAGYYLIDNGVGELKERAGYTAPALQKVRDTIRRMPEGFYLIGIEVATMLIVYAMLSRLDSLTPILAGLLLLLLPATQAAVDFMNNLVGFLISPRALPKLDFSKGIPQDCSTIVAVPTLLLTEVQVRDLVLDLEIRYLANSDRHLYFALLTDSPDAAEATDERDALVAVCEELVNGLNQRYGKNGRTPFYLFHRHRIFNASEGRWMGWERKRGKLLDLNQLLRGIYDSFPVKVGNLAVLPQIRYVITLDSDTQLPRNSAARMVGTLAHPLNRAVVDGGTNTVVEGYGILQPRIGISIQSAGRSRLAAIYSGQTGFDIYTRAVSDVYQDLFGEGIFTGKGIYDVDALNDTLGKRFPENALLSHDLIEGSYARAGLMSDVELIDDYPSHFSAYSRRKHRWVRGDWQITRWLLPRVPDYHGEVVSNPINLISRWKILDNLRRSLFEPASLMLLLAGWFYLPGSVWLWTGASVAMWLMPVWANLFFSILRVPRDRQAMKSWLRDLAKAFVNGHIMAVLGIVFLLHQALLSLDAIGRSVLRVHVTRKRLLEWETAAESEGPGRRKSTVDVYLEWTPLIAAVICLALWLVRPESLSAALPILVLWFASRAISDWLNLAPRAVRRELSEEDTELLGDCADRMLRFFDEWSTEQNNYLIPDNIRENGRISTMLSPTNAGFLLNARVVEVVSGKTGLVEFIAKTRRTLDTLVSLPKYRGHLLNWYDTDTLQPLLPEFVSTVDSGNLVACLWTLKQAALSFASEAPSKRGLTAEGRAELLEIGSICESLADAMDFSFLYLSRKKVLSVGYNTTTGALEKSGYDLLASESRIASFVAIAKGDIPQDAWFHLGRRHTMVRGDRVLVSWTGTMFEYLMPVLWMRHHQGTILQDSLESLVRVQQEYARRKGVPWGISESACMAEDGKDYGYAPFGVPDIAMKQPETESLVISPYSTFLALIVSPQSAMANLRRMQEFGWSGRYGFYEAVDYAHAGGEVVRSWMAHHQGMSLLAICNVLFDNPMQKFFHAEPRVLATELLLHERVPSQVIVETEEPPAAFAAA